MHRSIMPSSMSKYSQRLSGVSSAYRVGLSVLFVSTYPHLINPPLNTLWLVFFLFFPFLLFNWFLLLISKGICCRDFCSFSLGIVLRSGIIGFKVFSGKALIVP